MAPGCRGALRELLSLADRYYASGQAGLVYLSPRCAIAIDAARRIYSGIGRVIAGQNYDVRAPRAVVPLLRKLGCCVSALLAAGTIQLGRAARPGASLPMPRMFRVSDVQNL